MWLAATASGAISQRRIELLEAIEASGSISQAARDIGLSYKAAWDAVDSMNNLADGPLVSRSVGGRHGGGSRLTARGLRLIEVYRVAEAEFRGFLSRLGEGVADFEHFDELMKSLGVQTSARNELAGRVKAITSNNVNSEVVLDIGGGDDLVAIITNASVDRLGLNPGVAAYALVKAPSVMLSPPAATDSRVCTRLDASVDSVQESPEDSEITLKLTGGKTLTAIATAQNIEQLGLEPGTRVTVWIKATHVIVAVLT